MGEIAQPKQSILNLPKMNFVGLSGERLRYFTLLTLVAGVCICLPLLWVLDTAAISERTSNSETVLESESPTSIDTDYWYNNITIDPENNYHMKHTEYRPLPPKQFCPTC
jgi:hypothetical protein